MQNDTDTDDTTWIEEMASLAEHRTVKPPVKANNKVEKPADQALRGVSDPLPSSDGDDDETAVRELLLLSRGKPVNGPAKAEAWTHTAAPMGPEEDWVDGMVKLSEESGRRGNTSNSAEAEESQSIPEEDADEEAWIDRMINLSSTH